MGNVNCKVVQTAGFAGEVALAQLKASYLVEVVVEGARGKRCVIQFVSTKFDTNEFGGSEIK